MMKDTIFLLMFALVIVFQQSYAQVPYVNNSCYCIEESNAQPNFLYRYRVAQEDWIRMEAIEYTGGSSKLAERMEAMAINAVDGVIYAFDGDKFGSIEIGTNKFTYINSSLEGTGKIKGTIIKNFAFGDVDGLTYNPYTRELWATNRLNGNNANDILFKINPETGEVIKNFFGGYDFIEIEESFDSTLGGSVYDVDDIAINPFTNQLFAIQNQNGPGIITEINNFDGSIETEIFDLNEDDIEGLGFSSYGYLYGTTGDSSDVPSSLIAIDFVNYQTNSLDPIDISLPNGVGDFESFDCMSGFVDLALEAKINSQSVFSVGDIVDIDVIIHNQGTIEINKLSVTMHLPAGITLLSNGFTNWGAKRTKAITNQIILGGASYSFTVKLRLDNPALSNYSIPFEISNVENNQINLGQGYKVNLPDVDSTPDAINNETNIKNNQINQNGKFLKEDEDDHDIVSFSLPTCPQNIVVPNIDQPMYNAKNAIQTSGEVVNGAVEMYAGQQITFDIGFEVDMNGTFTADIQACL